MQTRSGSQRLAEHPKKEKQSVGQFFKELPVLVVVALGIAILVKAFVVQAFFIPSGSMENTLMINDRVLVSKFSYRVGEPEYPNVVVFESPLSERIPEPQKGPLQSLVDNIMQGLGLQSSEQDFIKRVIANRGPDSRGQGRVALCGRQKARRAVSEGPQSHARLWPYDRG